MTKWDFYKKTERKRHIYSDSFQQEVQDKLETLRVAREAIAGMERIFHDSYLSAEKSISSREKTDDMFFYQHYDYPPFSSMYEAGIEQIEMTVSCKGEEIYAEAMFKRSPEKETCLTCQWSYIEEDGNMYCSRTGNLVYHDDSCFGGYEKEDIT